MLLHFPVFDLKIKHGDVLFTHHSFLERTDLNLEMDNYYEKKNQDCVQLVHSNLIHVYQLLEQI